MAGESRALLFGGIVSPVAADMSGVGKECYSSTLVAFDLDCWAVVNATQWTGENRQGHSAVVRPVVAGSNGGDVDLVVVGGDNGRDLADMPALRIAADPADASSLLSPSPAAVLRRMQCRAQTWCARFNDCADCVRKPGCGWCGGTCRYGCGSDGAGTSGASCPPRMPLTLGGPAATGELGGSSTARTFVDFSVFVNAPEQDLVLTAAVTAGASTGASFPLSIAVLNAPSPSTGLGGGPPWEVSFTAVSASSTSAQAVLSALDMRRFGGWHVVRLSLAAPPQLPPSNNSNGASPPPRVAYKFAAAVTGSISGGGSPGTGGSANGDITPSAMLASGIIAILLSSVLALRRIARSQVLAHQQHQLNAGALALRRLGQPEVLASMYVVDARALAGPSQSLRPSLPFALRPYEQVTHNRSRSGSGSEEHIVAQSPPHSNSRPGSHGILDAELAALGQPFSVELHAIAQQHEQQQRSVVAFATFLVVMPGESGQGKSGVGRPRFAAATAVIAVSPEAALAVSSSAPSAPPRSGESSRSATGFNRIARFWQ
ncbi:hypothetical protein BC828DRAFT_399585 [Blastocladiella britannica]|nr:hypothetical protein BC828DRAFT_399585 [Blastocladiella britannica]